MRVLGVDPGLTRCGIGVVEGGLGRPLRLVAVGVVRTPPTDAPRAAAASQAEIDAWLDRHQPDAVAVERVFAERQRPAASWAPPRRPASPMLAAARRGLPVALHTPTEVKAAVTGNGRADKAQVDRDGDPASCGSTTRPSRPTPPTPWPWPSATSGAAAAQDRLAAAPADVPRPGSRQVVAAMIAPSAGAVLRVGLDSAVVEVGGSACCVHTHARHGRRRCASAHEAALATTWSSARTP